MLYALFGFLWILVSDRILAAIVVDVHTITEIQTYKGWAFVFASALLLYLAVFRELRIREQAEFELKQSEEKYRILIETANDAIITADAMTGIVLDANKKAEEMTGIPADEIKGKPQSRLHPPEEAERYQSIFSEHVKRGKVISEELYLCHRDGSRIPVEVSANTLELGGRKIIQGIFRDISFHKKAEEALQQANDKAQARLGRLSALHAIDMIINSSLDLKVTLNEFLDQVISELKVDAADVLLLNHYTQMLEFAAGKGFLSPEMKYPAIRLGEGIVGRAAMDRKNISIPDLRKETGVCKRTDILEAEGFISYYVIPLVAKGQVKGVLEIFHRSPLHFDAEWVGFFEALAAKAAIAIDNAALFDDLQRSNIELTLAYDATLEGWARALDLRSKETERHTERVTEMTLRLAREMGLSDRELMHIRRGALLHDIGKIGVPDSILQKPGALTPEEWEIMKNHPVHAFEMLLPIAYLRPALDIPYCHHEKWDGSGYPRGLKGEQIPLAARIFAVADVWDAMYSENRPYREALTEQKVREHIRSLSGVHLDPKVIDIFLQMDW